MKKIRVCNGPHCSYRGSSRIMEALQTFFKLKPGELNDTVDLNYCPCTGFCEQGPNVVVDDEKMYYGIKPGEVIDRLQNESAVDLVIIEKEIDQLLNEF